MDTVTTFPAAQLAPGDTYASLYHDEPIIVTVLREQEPATDFFGRPGHFRYWASRSDTGAQGWVAFGPGGIVHNHQPA